MDLALIHSGHYLAVHIHADNAMAGVGEHNSSRQTDVAEAENAAFIHRFTARSNNLCTSKISSTGIGDKPPILMALMKASQQAP